MFRIYQNFGGNDSTGPRYNGGVNTQVAYTKVTSFLCPSDQAKKIGSITLHNYVLNAGNSNFYQASTPLGCAGGTTVGGAGGCVTFGGAPFGWYEDPATLAAGGDSSPVNYGSGNPALGLSGRPRAISEILDGTSNTVCVSEIVQSPTGGSDYRGFSWWGGAAGFVTYQTPNNPAATDVMTGAGCGTGAIPGFPCTTTSTSTLPRMQLARSRHTGGVNAALCDGSVRFIRNTISITTWRALGSSQGGETLGNDY